jgi:hypothetical protein
MALGLVFQAEWSDGITTRMSVFCDGGEPDLGRAVRVSRAAYESRTKGNGLAEQIIAGHFERDGLVLRRYQNIEARQ